MYGFVDTVSGSASSTPMSLQTIFNEINLDEVLTDGNGSFITLTVSGRSNINQKITTIEVDGADGAIESDGATLEPREITVKYKIEDKTNEGFRERYNRLNALLEGSKKVLRFTDEDALFYATLLENDVPEEESNNLVGTIVFLCSDPYKYGPERTQIISASPANFSRPSPAYLSDGTKVAAGVPRYETGRFGKALMVEEGTVNLLTEEQANFRGGWGKFGSEANNVEVTYKNDSVIMEVTQDIVNNAGVVVYNTSVYDGKTITASIGEVEVQGMTKGSVYLVLEDAISGDYRNTGSEHITTNGVYRSVTVTHTFRTGLTTGNVQLRLRGINGGAKIVWRKGAQLEQKPYATTFTDGERKPETVSVPTQGVLSPEQGTIDVWVNVENPVRINGDFGVAFHIPRTVTETSGIGLRLYYTPGAVGWRVQSRNDENQTANIDIGEVPEGWRLFTVTWGLSTLALYVDGALKGRRDNSRFQSGFDDLILSSHDANNRYMLNTKFADLRLSRIARTDEEIAAYDLTKPLPVDEHAVKYSFDGELDATCKTMIENPGTAEADPIFELTTNQPTTFAMVANENDEYNMIGIPADDDVQVVDTKTSALYENGSTINTWQTATLDMVDDYFIKKITGTMGTDGAGIRADGYGTGEKLHGPAVFKELTNPIQDFEIETTFDIISRREIENFRMGILFLDENVNILGHIGIKDNSRTYKRRVPLARYGPYRGSGRAQGNLIGDSQKNDKARETTLFYLRAKREGEMFDFYIGEWQDYKHIRSWHETYSDTENEYSGRLKYITLYIAKWEDRPNPTRLRINSVEVFRLASVVEDQTPYILYPGDVVTFDHSADEILLNGENAMPLKDFGGDFFKLREDNRIIVMPDGLGASVKFRPRYR